MTKEHRISVKVDEKYKDALQEACAIVDLPEAALVRAAVSAVVYYIRKSRQVTLPLVAMPRREYEQACALLAEQAHAAR